MNLLNGKSKKPLILLILLLLFFGFYIFTFFQDFSRGQNLSFGVTFSKKYALDLELNWQKTYLAILDDLKVSSVRLIAYWDEIEKVQDEFDYTDLDWQIKQAVDRNITISLVIGRRAPRWPECHDPKWLANLAPLAIQQQQLEFLKAVVERYKDNPSIVAWQIENEPLFAWFGQCPKPSKNFLKQEVNLVKSLDSRPIIITDSGELNHWQGAGSVGDVLGVTMYRIVWNKYFGFWDYFFLPPAFYRYKADITKFFHKNLDDIIVTELQMEPWTQDQRMIELSLEEQQKSFTLERFRNNIEYVKKTGFTRVYLWGVEYWYFLEQKGYPEIWQEAKKLW